MRSPSPYPYQMMGVVCAWGKGSEKDREGEGIITLVLIQSALAHCLHNISCRKQCTCIFNNLAYVRQELFRFWWLVDLMTWQKV